MIKPEELFELNYFKHKDVFVGCKNVWDAINEIGSYILHYIINHDCENESDFILDNAYIEDNVYIGKNTVVEPGAFIQGPAIIGENCQIRSGAYIRGNVILGDGCIVGHCSELKNVIMLNGAQVPHFNYCGESILGTKVNLGCGTILSNLPLTSMKDPITGERGTIEIEIQGKKIDTGLSKFGAIIGDYTKTGCNCLFNPGTIVGKDCIIYPKVSLKKGFYGNNKIIKYKQNVEIVNKI